MTGTDRPPPTEPHVTLTWSEICHYETRTPLSELVQVLNSDLADGAAPYTAASLTPDDLYGSTVGALDEFLADRIHEDFAFVDEREISNVEISNVEIGETEPGEQR